MRNQSSNNRLRVWRAERQVTQIALSVKARIPMGRYWKIENGYATPTATEVKTLVRVLRANEPQDLFPNYQPTEAASGARTMSAPEPRTLSIQDMAAMFRLSARTIRRQLLAGEFQIQPLPLGGAQLRWSAAAVDAWFQKPTALRGMARRFA